jgi:hypothetical protein
MVESEIGVHSLTAAIRAIWPSAVVGNATVVQQLWGGYGSLLRVALQEAAVSSVIVKNIDWGMAASAVARHPRGWGGARSHQRKQQSYEVEVAFYQTWAAGLQVEVGSACRIPRCWGHHSTATKVQMFLEDLDAAGYPGRPHAVLVPGWQACLNWLAHFHAYFLGKIPERLWPYGTYWHLATRPDELAAMAPGPLQQAAEALDGALRACPWQTVVHGDAKLANFCFSADQRTVAAVDFQYVGGGIGTQDVVYFLGSVFSESQLAAHGQRYWSFYTDALTAALQRWQPDLDAQSVVQAWTALYEIAWADFARFLAGWCPEHPRQHAYTRDQVASALRQLAK